MAKNHGSSSSSSISSGVSINRSGSDDTRDSLATIVGVGGGVRRKIGKIGKRLARQQQFAAKLDAILLKRQSETSARASSANSTSTFGVSSLRDALSDQQLSSGSTASSKPKAAAPTKVRRNKAKKQVALSEMQQMLAVAAHPAFKANALATIREHLENTNPRPEQPADRMDRSR